MAKWKIPYDNIHPRMVARDIKNRTTNKFTFSFTPSKDTYYVLKRVKGKVKGNKGESKVARI